MKEHSVPILVVACLHNRTTRWQCEHKALAMACLVRTPLDHMANICRRPASQLYEKRKLAALEVEQVVKQLAAAGRADRIDAVIGSLTSYATSSQVRGKHTVAVLRACGSLCTMSHEHQSRMRACIIACAMCCPKCTPTQCTPPHPLHVRRRPMHAKEACCAWQPQRWHWPGALPGRCGLPTCCSA